MTAMAELDGASSSRAQRKSVAFSEGTTVVDGNGEVTEVNGTTRKSSAESHASPSAKAEASSDKDVDEVTDMFKGLAKKKKPKKVKEGDVTSEKPAADGEFDPSTMKKKKKKKPKADTDDFEAKLAEAGATGEGEESKAEAAPVEEGNMDAGTGVWAHNATQQFTYNQLLGRFFSLLHNSHPDLMSGGSKSYKIPPPQCLREGNKKTIFANIDEISKRMKRSDEHVTQFLFAEFATSGSVDGSQRLVIKGRFQQKQIENVLRRYIVEYVQCKTCKSGNTELSKGENRLYFITCNSCGSRRSVTAIKSGFSAQIGKRKRQQA